MIIDACFPPGAICCWHSRKVVHIFWTTFLQHQLFVKSSSALECIVVFPTKKKQSNDESFLSSLLHYFKLTFRSRWCDIFALFVVLLWLPVTQLWSQTAWTYLNIVILSKEIQVALNVTCMMPPPNQHARVSMLEFPPHCHMSQCKTDDAHSERRHGCMSHIPTEHKWQRNCPLLLLRYQNICWDTAPNCWNGKI